jgi:hypothetical protein
MLKLKKIFKIFLLVMFYIIFYWIRWFTGFSFSEFDWLAGCALRNCVKFFELSEIPKKKANSIPFYLLDYKSTGLSCTSQTSNWFYNQVTFFTKPGTYSSNYKYLPFPIKYLAWSIGGVLFFHVSRIPEIPASACFFYFLLESSW